MNKAYFAGGCFWCISDYILSLKLDGVIDVVVGYSGGEEKSASYELVKSQQSKHRETIEITYDETKISLKELLDIFTDYVDIHDPDGQYIDKGYSYTLALYYQNDSEKQLFKEYISKLEEPVYIAIEEFKFFVKAEEYHQHFGDKNPEKLKEELMTSNRTCHFKLRFKNKIVRQNPHFFIFCALKTQIKL